MMKNKDGTPYKLKGPNKLAKNQKSWDMDKVVLHNQGQWGKVEVHEADMLYRESPPEPKQQEPPKQVEIKLEPPKPEPEPPKQEPKPEPERQFKKTVLFHCLPTIVYNYEDKFYGEKGNKIKYGKKFIFEGIVIESTDLEISFWTNNSISERSVVYPFSYQIGKNKVPYDDYRWWRVMNVVEKDGGYLIHGIISDFQPTFSD